MNKETLYVIRLGNLPYYKIGYTQHLETRLTFLENGLPLQIELIVSYQSEQAKDIENALHCKFAKKRTHGEWFKLSKEDITLLKNSFKKNPHNPFIHTLDN